MGFYDEERLCLLAQPSEEAQMLFPETMSRTSPFVVSLSNHERALRQAQGERAGKRIFVAITV